MTHERVGGLDEQPNGHRPRRSNHGPEHSTSTPRVSTGESWFFKQMEQERKRSAGLPMDDTVTLAPLLRKPQIELTQTRAGLPCAVIHSLSHEERAHFAEMNAERGGGWIDTLTGGMTGLDVLEKLGYDKDSTVYKVASLVSSIMSGGESMDTRIIADIQEIVLGSKIELLTMMSASHKGIAAEFKINGATEVDIEKFDPMLTDFAKSMKSAVEMLLKAVKVLNGVIDGLFEFLKLFSVSPDKPDMNECPAGEDCSGQVTSGLPPALGIAVEHVLGYFAAFEKKVEFMASNPESCVKKNQHTIQEEAKAQKDCMVFLSNEMNWGLEFSVDMVGSFSMHLEVEFVDTPMMDDNTDPFTATVNYFKDTAMDPVFEHDDPKEKELAKLLMSKTMQHCKFEKELAVGPTGDVTAEFHMDKLSLDHIYDCGTFLVQMLYCFMDPKCKLVADSLKENSGYFPATVVGETIVQKSWASVMVDKEVHSPAMKDTAYGTECNFALTVPSKGTEVKGWTSTYIEPFPGAGCFACRVHNKPCGCFPDKGHLFLCENEANAFYAALGGDRSKDNNPLTHADRESPQGSATAETAQLAWVDCLDRQHAIKQQYVAKAAEGEGQTWTTGFYYQAPCVQAGQGKPIKCGRAVVTDETDGYADGRGGTFAIGMKGAESSSFSAVLKKLLGDSLEHGAVADLELDSASLGFTFAVGYGAIYTPPEKEPPVALERGSTASLDQLLDAAEHVLAEVDDAEHTFQGLERGRRPQQRRVGDAASRVLLRGGSTRRSRKRPLAAAAALSESY